MATLALIVDGVVVQHFELNTPKTLIGRAADNQVRIDDLAVSSHHARVERIPNNYLEGIYDYFLQDLNSTNGTLVNGSKVERVQLQPNDEIRIGWNTFKLMDDTRPGMEQTAYILPGGD
ncbi:MAG: FHA domain-containing protein [Ectothiorhodospiraceae bacterium]|nr:FHA domain-containing protein [Ectothiorhodospiraceae bacterium]MCH8504384.1 FHA domain-containing protein [Ectothiorhodospiraceae bacterium]